MSKSIVVVTVVLEFDDRLVSPPGEAEVMALFEPSDPGQPDNLVPVAATVSAPLVVKP